METIHTKEIIMIYMHTHTVPVHPDIHDVVARGAAIAAGTAMGIIQDESLLPKPSTDPRLSKIPSDGKSDIFIYLWIAS